MKGASRSLTRPAVAIEESERSPTNLEDDFTTQTRPGDQVHSIWSIDSPRRLRAGNRRFESERYPGVCEDSVVMPVEPSSRIFGQFL
jgi:hypothetical protein